eukprot:gene9359-10162_t
MASLLFNLFAVIMISIVKIHHANEIFYVCEAADPKFLGDLAPWPPETHYRCVEASGCNYNLATPPTSEEGDWKGSKKHNDGGSPRVSATPCATVNSEEL